MNYLVADTMEAYESGELAKLLGLEATNVEKEELWAMNRSF